MHAQFWMEISSPSQASPCVDYPIEITLYNDGGDATEMTTLSLELPDGFHYLIGSHSSIISEEDLGDPMKPVFGIPAIPQCESVSFFLWLSHDCLERSEDKEISANWEADPDSGHVVNSQTTIRLFGLRMRIYDLNVYYDSTDQTFKKSFNLINTGQVPFSEFVFYVEGEDNMNILSSNVGNLSANGDTLTFNGSDFTSIGNGNSLFEPGEEIRVENHVNLNACQEAFPFHHVMIVPCGNKSCSFEVESSNELKVTIGDPRLVILQQADQTATACDTGVVELKLTNRSFSGSFPQGNALYNLRLNPGWSVIQNNRRTEPRRDNCLRIFDAEVMGRGITIRTQGYSGYGLDFTRLTSDPDGPGGLSDLDGDGRYDDLASGDTICLTMRYRINPSCLSVSCNGSVFSSRILRMESFYEDYCEEDIESNSYLSRHNYYWAGSGGSLSGLDGVYVDGAEDTLVINFSKSVSGFLDNCVQDSAIIRIDFPPVVDLPPGAIVTVNGDTVNYTYQGRRLTITTDTSRARVIIPVGVSCDPGSSGNIQTACTFCLGSGFPKHRIQFEMDYFCDDGCFGRIPLICGRSNEFVSVCDSASAGIISEGKFVIDDMVLKRENLGFNDEDRQNPITQQHDSLDLETLAAFDTFRLEVPFDIRCDANYQNVVFKLVQNAIQYFNGSDRDTIRYFDFLSDTLKYYDAETMSWSTCVNPLGDEFYELRNNGYRNNYVSEVNVSQLGCLNGTFSTTDSLVFIIKGRVRNTLRSNVQRVRIRTDLTYRQDGCNQDSQGELNVNAFSGIPRPGGLYLSQPYSRDTLSNKFYNEISVCGEFQLSVYVDNLFYYQDTIDPFRNEIRQLYELKDVKVIIPDYFAIDTLPFNLVKEFYNTFDREYSRDTSKAPFTIYDSATYHVVHYPIHDQADFEAARRFFRLNLIPDCYGFIEDSIHVHKAFRIQTHASSPVPRDTQTQQSLSINMVGLEPVFETTRQQFLFDSILVAEFELRSSIESHIPSSYFDFHYTWFTLDHLGHLQIDSLVEYTDTTSKVWTPDLLGNHQRVYRLDSTKQSRRFRLHGKVRTCERDTLYLTFGNSCTGYPTDFYDLGESCERLKTTEQVLILPETPDLQIKFVSTPDTLQSTPCDTFEYEIEVRNSNLGHLSDHLLRVDEVDGLIWLDGEIEYPENTWNPLPAPTLDNGQWVFDLSTLFDSTGFRGFYNPGLNVYSAKLRYSGDCDIQDGVFLSVQASGYDLCQNENLSGKINSSPLIFDQDTLSNIEDLYQLDLRFNGDTLCGETFVMRATFTSISDLTNVSGQRITLSYLKELGFIPQSYRAIRNVENDIYDFNIYDDQEQISIDLSQGVNRGDSVVFECEFERTCIGVCKPTDFAIDILLPRNIACPLVSGGECQLSLSAQNWTFDDVIVAPIYNIVGGQGRLIRNPDGTEQLEAEFEIENLSQFAINTLLIINFFEDVDGNGRVNMGDLMQFQDTVASRNLKPFATDRFRTLTEWPANAGCHWLAVIGPSDNSCICESDTIAFPQLELVPLRDTVRSCYSNPVPVGFTPSPGYQYQWLNSSQVMPNNQSRGDFLFSVPIDRVSEVTEILELRSERANGCFVIDTVVVTLYRPGGEIMVSDSILCHGDVNGSISANLAFGDGSTRYQWSNGRTESTIDSLATGTYQVILSDENGCRDTLSIILDEPAQVEDSLSVASDYNGFAITCYGDSTGSVSIEVEGGTSPYRITHLESMQQGNVITGLAEGWNHFLVRDRNGCESLDSIYLDQPPPLNIESRGSKAGCDEDHLASAQSTAEGGVGGFRYEWSTGAMGDSIGGLDVGKHFVTAYDANGCPISDTIYIERFPDPGISVNLLDTLIEYGDVILLHAQSNTKRGTYMWFPEEKVSCDTCQSTKVNTLEDLTVLVRVVDENGCEAWEEITIRVEITKRVWAPNAITVNGDGVNDGFTLFGNESLEIIESLRIFDRWGEQVFFKELFAPGQPELGWPGDLNGTQMNPAVFAWVAKVRFVDGEERVLFGDVTVVR